MKYVLMAVLVVVVTFAAADINEAVATAAPSSCESLAALKLPDTTIKSATSVPAGAFTPPGQTPSAQPLTLPAFCRVVATTTPAVNFEVWLPLQDWNGSFRASAT